MENCVKTEPDLNANEVFEDKMKLISPKNANRPPPLIPVRNNNTQVSSIITNLTLAGTTFKNDISSQ